MSFSFEGKRCLVTGAGRGIGREVVKKLVINGATVVALSKTQSNLDSLKQELPQVETICVDLGDWKATENALKNVQPIDLLVNNAAYAELTTFGTITEDTCDKQINVNVKAVINVTQSLVEGMKQRGGGSIVNLSSIAGLTGLQDHLVYGATKGGLDMITRILALELGPYKIRVNSVNPTVTMTDMSKVGWSDQAKANAMLNKTPIGRFAEPEEVAETILFLLSDSSAMITGITLPIDGGLLACKK